MEIRFAAVAAVAGLFAIVPNVHATIPSRPNLMETNPCGWWLKRKGLQLGLRRRRTRRSFEARLQERRH